MQDESSNIKSFKERNESSSDSEHSVFKVRNLKQVRKNQTQLKEDEIKLIKEE